jgi:hypothetical protein
LAQATTKSSAPSASASGAAGAAGRADASTNRRDDGTMDKSVSFTTAELVALDAAVVWFIAELRARTDRADSEVDREMSADQMNHLIDARKKIHDGRKHESDADLRE